MAEEDRSWEGPAGYADWLADLKDQISQARLAGIIRHCIGQMIANEACVAAGIDREGVHQMRVVLRRLRSALVLFRSFVPAEQYDWLTSEVKWLADMRQPK